jgi:hypothetical protein
MRTSDDAPVRDRIDDNLDDGEQDVDPLLPSAEGTLERVKAEIEHDLGSSRGENAYDRMSYFHFQPIIISQYYFVKSLTFGIRS